MLNDHTLARSTTNKDHWIPGGLPGVQTNPCQYSMANCFRALLNLVWAVWQTQVPYYYHALTCGIACTVDAIIYLQAELMQATVGTQTNNTRLTVSLQRPCCCYENTTLTNFTLRRLFCPLRNRYQHLNLRLQLQSQSAAVVIRYASRRSIWCHTIRN